MPVRIITGDCREVLRTLPDASVQCVVTSPPYYGLRDYGTAQWDGGDPACDHSRPSSKVGAATTLRQDGRKHEGLYDREKAEVSGYPFRDTCGKCGARRIDAQIGLEATPDEYIATMVEVFREVRRMMRDDGTLWLNLGDSYNANPGQRKVTDAAGPKQMTNNGAIGAPSRSVEGLAAKQLLMMPARVALALQADGWWLRSEIVWAKPNPMPESVADRPTSAHEKVYLLAKSARYFFDAEAVREEGIIPAGTLAAKGSVERAATPGVNARPPEYKEYSGTRNCRNVWTIATSPFPQAHFATFPPELAERCIKAGSRPRDMVLDPFGGAGTVGLVADRLGRDAVLIELNPMYASMARNRVTADAGMFAEVAD